MEFKKNNFITKLNWRVCQILESRKLANPESLHGFFCLSQNYYCEHFLAVALFSMEKGQVIIGLLPVCRLGILSCSAEPWLPRVPG